VSGELVFGGKPLPRALDDIRRYCGLSWSGGAPEVFAYPYFDALEERIEDDEIRPVDVLAASVLHPGLRKRDLTYFVQHRSELRDELEMLPSGLDLADASARVVERLTSLGSRVHPDCGLALFTKVLHTKRPKLVPMLDRALTDCYRRSTGGRGESVWGECVRLFRDDLVKEANRAALTGLQTRLRAELGGRVPSALRLADVAIWMAAGER
jgi:hypothetical protein